MVREKNYGKREEVSSKTIANCWRHTDKYYLSYKK